MFDCLSVEDAMADLEPSPTGSARLPPLTSQFPQWSRATPLAPLAPSGRHEAVPGFLRVRLHHVKICNNCSITLNVITDLVFDNKITTSPRLLCSYFVRSSVR